jgi:hypothetical protein
MRRLEEIFTIPRGHWIFQMKQVSHVKSALPQSGSALCGFTRVYLKQGQITNATVNIPVEQLRFGIPGQYLLLIGAASDDIRLK